ncbi:fused (3R)-hydroxyacyl-ACP dehydratase subunits HadA/HadB [Nocardia sp. KC 131]|uniref:fused (3R)-hydroxyacyl-ACP dehydratase subunits HadA/HadB n=1 Tax=Nocardia arseniciresistens TaxID=3392119 RepID=UPI00398E3580
MTQSPCGDRLAGITHALTGRAHLLPGGPYDVGREKIREFANAVQAKHPAHYREQAAAALGHDKLIAPITFTAILSAVAQQHIFGDLLPGYDVTQVLHTEQYILSHRPIRSGDRLNCLISLRSFRRSHGQDKFVFSTDVIDCGERLVQTIRTAAVARSDGIVDEKLVRAAKRLIRQDAPGARAPMVEVTGLPLPAMPFTPRPTLEFDDVSVGDDIGAASVRLSRGDLVNFAGVSGDVNPIHWNSRVAVLAGLDNVVAHGLLTMSLSAGYIASWAGDPGAVREHGVRFISPVFVDANDGGDVKLTGSVRALDPITKVASIALDATSRGRKLFGRATATVQLG